MENEENKKDEKELENSDINKNNIDNVNEEVKYLDDIETASQRFFRKNKDKVEKSKSIVREIIEWIICFIIAYILYLNINYFIGTVSGVRQVSMLPTAKEGERVLIQRNTIFKKELKYGDIITFEAPNSNEDENSYNLVAQYENYTGINKFLYGFVGIGKLTYIKRVIGLPGDHIVITANGDVYRNNEKLEEDYLNDDTTNIIGSYCDIVVPEDTVYVMGDNRLQSKDSRVLGCIPISKINGYVIGRVWPLNKIGGLDK